MHPASPVLDVSSLGRQLLAPGVFALGAGGVRLLVVGVAVVLLARLVAWWRMTYVLDDGVLRVESGVVVRTQELVPCDRIQQVNLTQKLRHRPLGVAMLEVRTAVGGGAPGIVLEVLATGEAEELRRALLNAAPSPLDEGGRDDVATSRPVVELTHAQLAVAGLTGVQLLVVFVFAATAFQLLGDLPWVPWEDLDVGALVVMDRMVVAAALAGFILVWLGSAAAASVFADAGYRLTLVGDELHVSRGLLDRKEAVLPRSRVQAVRVAASAPRRLLGLVSLRIQSAGTGSGRTHSRVAVPVLPVADLDRVLALVLPGAVLPSLRRPPPAALRRSLVRRVVPATALALVVTAAARPWGAMAAALVPAAAALGVVAYRGLGHALTEGFLVARSGSFNRHTVVMPLQRTQSGRVRAGLWQRRAGLATLLVDLAGPGPSPRVLDESAAIAEGLLAGVVGRVAKPPPG